jgi:peptidoglycan/LPS O-acetylase OafA/YrhL
MRRVGLAQHAIAFATGSAIPDRVSAARPIATKYRPDIDGLRAVAIAAVFVFHAKHDFLPGGFIGVDVFFVISGFLIIRIILDDLKTNTFSLTAFYARRIRRIFPALICVLAAIWAVGWHLMLPEDFQELGKQIFAGAAFSSNLLTYSQVGYFDAPAITKPFLHLWSLGVEEQFYLVTPLALIAAARWRLSVPWTLGVGAAASFASNVVLVRYDQAAAFYLPFTRFWELLVGGGLAYAVVHFPRHLLRLQHWTVSLLGMLLIGGATLVTPFALFPGWWAVPPVFGSALVIVEGPSTAVNKVLASSPAVAIGLISYPLYLWHWPLLVLMREEFPSANRPFLVLLAISLALAAATYLFIERPVRALRLRPLAVGAAAMMFLIGMAGAETVRTAGLPGRYNPPFPAILLPAATPPFGGTHAEVGNVAGPKILVWGDSHAAHLLPGFVALRQVTPMRIYPQDFSDCPPTRTHPESKRQHCMDEIGKIEQRVALLQPDIAILASYWPYQDRIEGLSEPLTFLRDINVRRLIVMGYVPRWPKTLQKVVIQAYLENPSQPVPVRLSNFVRIDRAVERYLREAAARFGARYISPMETLCNIEGCLVRVGDKPGDLMQFDDNHLTVAGSKFFVRSIARQVLD